MHAGRPQSPTLALAGANPTSFALCIQQFSSGTQTARADDLYRYDACIILYLHIPASKVFKSQWVHESVRKGRGVRSVPVAVVQGCGVGFEIYNNSASSQPPSYWDMLRQREKPYRISLAATRSRAGVLTTATSCEIGEIPFRRLGSTSSRLFRLPSLLLAFAWRMRSPWTHCGSSGPRTMEPGGRERGTAAELKNAVLTPPPQKRDVRHPVRRRRPHFPVELHRRRNSR